MKFEIEITEADNHLHAVLSQDGMQTAVKSQPLQPPHEETMMNPDHSRKASVRNFFRCVGDVMLERFAPDCAVKYRKTEDGSFAVVVP